MQHVCSTSSAGSQQSEGGRLQRNRQRETGKYRGKETQENTMEVTEDTARTLTPPHEMKDE